MVDHVRPDGPVVPAELDDVAAGAPGGRLAGPAPGDQLEALAALVGHLAAEVHDEAAARLPLVARDAFARLARLVGADRVVLWHAERGHDRLLLAQEWARAGSSPGIGAGSVSGVGASDGPGFEVAGGAGFEAAGGADDLSGRLAELLGVEPLTGPVGARLEQGGPVPGPGGGAVVAVPLVLDGALDAVLSIHWSGEAAAWSAPLAPLVRALATLLRDSERLVELAERPALDELTGLANRKLLLVALGRSLAQLERRATSGVAVVACQVAAGPNSATNEELVRRVGRRLDRETREGDLVAVFDGRTLVVVCDGVAGSDDALAIARRLSAAVGPGGWAADADDADDPRRPGAIGASFGVAHAAHRVPPGVLLRQADAAAYLAATSGQAVRLAEA